MFLRNSWVISNMSPGLKPPVKCKEFFFSVSTQLLRRKAVKHLGQLYYSSSAVTPQQGWNWENDPSSHTFRCPHSSLLLGTGTALGCCPLGLLTPAERKRQRSRDWEMIMLSTSKTCRQVHNISSRSLDHAVTHHHKTVPFLTTDVVHFLSLCTLCASGSPVTQTERTERHLFSKWHFPTPFLSGF